MIQTEQKDQTLVVRPQGQIVASNAQEFKQELQKLVDEGHRNLTIDLAGVDIIDSKGLAVFVVCHKSLSEKNGKLIVVTHNEDFATLFRIMRLDSHFEVCSPQ